MHHKRNEKRFLGIIQLIKHSRSNAIRAVNAEMINLYWSIGAYISKKIESSEWGESVVKELAAYIQKNEPELKGFSDKNMWRMKQFYETYRDFPKLSPLVREISWTHNLLIFSRCKNIQEREFYVKMVIDENYSKRELDRQISAGLFECTMLGNAKKEKLSKKRKHDLLNSFKDSYVFEFLHLPAEHNEQDLQKGLVKQMKEFVLVLGKDFLFVSEQYKIQVGQSDFFLICCSFTEGYNVWWLLN